MDVEEDFSVIVVDGIFGVVDVRTLHNLGGFDVGVMIILLMISTKVLFSGESGIFSAGFFVVELVYSIFSAQAAARLFLLFSLAGPFIFPRGTVLTSSGVLLSVIPCVFF